jgi:hypothetical protein
VPNSNGVPGERRGVPVVSQLVSQTNSFHIMCVPDVPVHYRGACVVNARDIYTKFLGHVGPGTRGVRTLRGEGRLTLCNPQAKNRFALSCDWRGTDWLEEFYEG